MAAASTVDASSRRALARGAVAAIHHAMPTCLRPILTGAALLAATGPALADCPTSVAELPATGLIAKLTRIEMDQDSGTMIPKAPKIDGNIGVAGGMQADTTTDALGTGSLSARLALRKGEFNGCASADVLDVRSGAAHLTAAGQIPLMFTSLRAGSSVDRDIKLPLAARREFLAAPIDRIAGHMSLSFIDLELTDGATNFRVLAMPFTVEQALAQQQTATRTLDRHSTHLETSMFQLVTSGPEGTGELGVFSLQADSIEIPRRRETEALATSVVRISFLALEIEGERWGWELDGGVLSIGGEADCEVETCNRGFYVGSLRHAWDKLSVEGRIERSGFFAADDSPAYEDRASATVTLGDAKRKLAATAFIANARAWLTDHAQRSAGTRVALTQTLSKGFTANVDGELVRTSGDLAPMAEQPAAPTAARAMVSLAWSKHLIRY